MSDGAGSKRPGLLGKSKELIEGAVTGLKPKDINALVDEFTGEMTLVAEGLSEDLSLARQQLNDLSASQTIAEEALRSNQQQLSQLEKRLDALEKRVDKQQKRGASLSSLLRQVTIIAAIIGGAWVLTALLQLLKG